MSTRGPRLRDADFEDSGRACPYCRFALKEGMEVVECGACYAAHHVDCWSDNGGCSVMGCAGGPGTAATTAAPRGRADRRRTPAPAPPPPPAYGAAPQPPPPAYAAPSQGPAPQRGGGQRASSLVVAVLVLALALAGVAVALVVSSGKTPAPAGAGSTSSSGDATSAVAPAPPQSTSEGTPPPPPAEVRAADIQAVVQSYYGAVRTGDFDRAWGLLSPTYKAWKEQPANGGRAKWTTQERRNRNRLRVGTVGVDVRSFDAASGVATIYVAGMRFMRDDGSLCDYEGITWARRAEDGGWQYDQGFLQNEARKAKWRPRATESLGYNCEASGY